MKGTGIVRRMDELGRLVIPKELRDTLNIKNRDALEIFVDGDQIILKKFSHANTCMVTGEISSDNLVMADGHIVLSPEGVTQLLGEMQAYLETHQVKN